MSQIAVITRTSNRPNYFNRCYQSVLNQPLVGSHHVIYDNLNDEHYLTKKFIFTYYIDPTQILYDEPPPETATPPKLCIHNLYFNCGTYDTIDEPWVYHLDDDNYLVDNAFLNLESYLKEDIDLIILRIYHQNLILPSEENFNNHNIELAGIDTGCFLARTDLVRQIEWDGWKCADYRFILKCSQLSKKTVWLNQIVMRQDDINNGNRQDYIQQDSTNITESH